MTKGQAFAHSGGPNSTFCSVSPDPEPKKMMQPDGNEIDLRIFGGKYAIYLETLLGYTVLKDEVDGYYKYAVQGSDGDLYISDIKVTPGSVLSKEEELITNQIDKHLRHNGVALSNMQKQFNPHSSAAEGPASVFPSTGNRRALLLLIEYPDQPSSFTEANFENLANQEGYNVNGQTGSFKDYYMAMSYGQLNITTDVSDWYTAANDRAEYGHGNGYNVAVDLVREAVDAAEADGVNFANYDGDGDGKVDVVMVIHSGRGAEESGSSDDIWSHRWVLSANSKSVFYDGKLINDYIIQAEKYGSTKITNIGVLCHEFGHALGLPDLYDTDGDSRGLGKWCVMASGTWNNSGKTPAHMSAWCKSRLGWTNYSVLAGSGSISDLASTNEASSGYRVNTDNPNEYFLLENRQKTGWDAYLPTSGLAIFHIDESKSTNQNQSAYLVNLEQADGLNHLNNNQNAGDSGDLFPGSNNKTSFGCTSEPASSTNDGSSTNRIVYNITHNSGLISFTYGDCVTCSGTPDPGSTISSSEGPAENTPFQLSLSNSLSEGSIYFQWQKSADQNTWINIAGATDEKISTSIETDTWFRCLVTCTASGQSNSSLALKVEPSSYCAAQASDASFESISRVTFATIDWESTEEDGYEDFTAVSTTVNPGNTYDFAAEIHDPYDSDTITVWIDFNQDETFATSEKVLSSSVGESFSGSISIPEDASIGFTRMRVLLQDTNSDKTVSPCGNVRYGQVEDYSIYVGSSDCVNEMTLASPTSDFTEGNHKVEVNQSIYATNKIMGGNVIYDAGLSVTLDQNFQVLQGATFTIQIDGCGNE